MGNGLDERDQPWEESVASRGRKKDRKPLRATAGHLLPLPFYTTWPLSLLGMCVSLDLYPVRAACPWLHRRRQLMLSHVSTVAAPAANNQRQLFGKYRRCLIGSTDGLDSLFSRHAPSLI